MSIPARTKGSVRVRAQQSYAARQILIPIQRFIHTESTSGIVLLAAAAMALFWVNSPWGGSYDAFWDAKASVHIGQFSLAHSLREWVNDGLMTLFFFVVGLEVKREFVHGELSNIRKAALPIAAALGGMLIPAALYAVFNAGTATVQGWGVPMATDIAFAVGVLALLGDRVPPSVRITLLALATVDDIGAILVIALFYSANIALFPGVFAMGCLLAVFAMRRLGVHKIQYYIPVALLFWFAVLQSGIHATIAGVILGLMTPAKALLKRRDFVKSTGRLLEELGEAERSGSRNHADALLGEIEELTSNTEAPVDRLLRVLHGWSGYVVLPLFALANAGVTLTPAAAWGALASHEGRGVLAGLVAGKVAGIALFAWIAVRLGLADLPPGVRWAHVAGVGLLGGIGFTVSLFIADLAFSHPDSIANAKIGILLASLLSGLLGYGLLRLSARVRENS